MKDKAKPYWEDICPVCREPCIKACKCALNDRGCKNGHVWRRLYSGETIVLDDFHGQPLDKYDVG